MTIPVFAAVGLDPRIIRYVKSENNSTLAFSRQGEKLLELVGDCPFLWLIEDNKIVYSMPMTTSYMAHTLLALHDFNLHYQAGLVHEYITMAIDQNYDFFPDPE